MLLKKAMLPLLTVGMVAAALAGTPATSGTPETQSARGRLVSRTMPPSDPKPDGPKRPRLTTPLVIV